MKKLLVIPVLFIYLLAVSGIMISVHYCGQQMESWNVFTDNKGCEDDGCRDKEKDGCCKDEVVNVKVSGDQNITSVFKIKAAPAFDIAILPQAVIPLQPVFYKAVAIKAHMPNAPPGLWQQLPLYKLHSRFTYYG